MGTIGIIGAMEVEVKELKEQMQITRQLTKAGMEFCEGILEGQDVVVVRSGVGKVNAAVCTQILIDVFDVKAVINTGIAGSLKAEINIGDLVISSDLVHHDMDAVSFGYPKGQIPQMDVFSFEADRALADLAEKVKRLIRKFRYFTEELSAAISSSQTKKPKRTFRHFSQDTVPRWKVLRSHRLHT